MTQESIITSIGTFSKARFKSLIRVRKQALYYLREQLGYFITHLPPYTEVTTSSLVNIAGSCENPEASFKLNYYGRDAHLSQSSQVQLEALVLRLNAGYFTVNNSFRAEHYNDPSDSKRRLSEFTLIEAERGYTCSADHALNTIILEQENLVKGTVGKLLKYSEDDLRLLGADNTYLHSITQSRFHKITYDEALDLLIKAGGNYTFGDDLGVKEEQAILAAFDNVPTCVTHLPSNLKFFNLKQMSDGLRTYSADLLLPKLGETIGGGVREENGFIIKKQLLSSRVAQFLQKNSEDPIAVFGEYLRIFDEEKPVLRAGYGIGFERFVAFLLGSTDIFETIAFRTLRP